MKILNNWNHVVLDFKAITSVNKQLCKCARINTLWQSQHTSAYMITADPKVSMFPGTEGGGQGAVGSLLVLLSIHLTAWWCFLLDLAMAPRLRLVQRCPDLVILRGVCLELHAEWMELVGEVKTVWPVATLESWSQVGGSRRSRASPPDSPSFLTFICLQWSNIRRSPIAVNPWDDGSESSGDRNTQGSYRLG